MTLISLKRPDFTSLYENTRKYTIQVDAANAEDTSTQKVPIFEQGSLEDLLHWRKQFDQLMRVKDWNANAANLFRNARLLLEGEALEKFEIAFQEIVGQQNLTVARFNNTMARFMELSTPNDIAESLRDWLSEIRKPRDMSVSDFYNRYKEINSYLPYLPGPLNVSFDEATVFSHIKKSVPAFARDFKRHHARTTVNNVRQLVQYYTDLEETEEKTRSRNRNKTATATATDETRTTTMDAEIKTVNAAQTSIASFTNQPRIAGMNADETQRINHRNNNRNNRNSNRVHKLTVTTLAVKHDDNRNVTSLTRSTPQTRTTMTLAQKPLKPKSSTFPKIITKSLRNQKSSKSQKRTYQSISLTPLTTYLKQSLDCLFLMRRRPRNSFALSLIQAALPVLSIKILSLANYNTC